MSVACLALPRGRGSVCVVDLCGVDVVVVVVGPVLRLELVRVYIWLNIVHTLSM